MNIARFKLRKEINKTILPSPLFVAKIIHKNNNNDKQKQTDNDNTRA